jgi:hypothetical protein
VAHHSPPVMTTTISVLVDTSVIAQTQPAPTLGEMKSSIEQQANQEMEAAKDAAPEPPASSLENRRVIRSNAS